MATTDQQKVQTYHCMDGVWGYQTEDTLITVEIEAPSKFRVVISRPKDLERDYTNSAGAHWFGEHLCFIDNNSPYYILQATEEEMVFGELHTAGLIGESKWIHKFKRLK